MKFHLNDQDGGQGPEIRTNIDAWWPHIEAGVEAIVINASGCGTMVKDYGHVLRDDPAHAKAIRVSALARDLGTAGGWCPRCSSVFRICPRTTGNLAPHRVSPAMHLAARPEAQGAWWSPTWRRWAMTSRLLVAKATSAAARPVPIACSIQRWPTSCATANSAIWGFAAHGDCIGQHRLHHPPAKRHRHTGAPLGGSSGCWLAAGTGRCDAQNVSKSSTGNGREKITLRKVAAHMGQQVALLLGLNPSATTWMPSAWAMAMMALHRAKLVESGTRLCTNDWSILMKSMSNFCR